MFQSNTGIDTLDSAKGIDVKVVPFEAFALTNRPRNKRNRQMNTQVNKHKHKNNAEGIDIELVPKKHVLYP